MNSINQDPSTITLGRTLTIARAVRGMSQAELARKSGLSPSYICHLESEKRMGTRKCLENISSALDMMPSQLLKVAEVADTLFEKASFKRH